MIRGWRLGTLLGLLLAVGLVFHLQRSRDLLVASRVTEEVEARTTVDLQRGTLEPERLHRQIEILRELAPLAPADPTIPMAIGSHFLLLERPDSAIRWYERSRELEARPEVLINLARAWHLAGDDEEARRYLSMAAVLDPNLTRQEGTFLPRRPEAKQ